MIVIDICLRVVDTSRVSGVVLGLIAAIALMLGWQQAAFVAVMIWAVPVAVSGGVLLVGHLVWHVWLGREMEGR